MPSDGSSTDSNAPAAPAAEATENRVPEPRPLTPVAERALAEAAARRAEGDRKLSGRPQEIRGRGGLEPTRYGDWEINGLASDF